MGKSREHIAIPSWEGGRHGGPRAREESLTARGGLDQEAGQEIGVARLTKYYYRDQRTEDLGRGGGGGGRGGAHRPSQFLGWKVQDKERGVPGTQGSCL